MRIWGGIKDSILEGVGNILVGGIEQIEKIVLAPIDGAIKLLETIEEVAEDPVLEGKKLGYERAAQEYLPVVKRLKSNYHSALKKFKVDSDAVDAQIETADKLLEQLEEQKQKLWDDLYAPKAGDSSASKPRYSKTAFSNMAHAFSNGSIDAISHSGEGGLLMDVLLSSKRKKKAQAEAEGYEQAKEEHEKKIAELKGAFDKFIKESDEAIQGKLKLLSEYYREIADVELAIANLKLYGVE